MVAVGDFLSPPHFLGYVGDHRLHHFHHVVVIGVGLVALQQSELRVVVLVDALIAKYPAQLVHLVKTTDYETLQVQLGGDTQV